MCSYPNCLYDGLANAAGVHDEMPSDHLRIEKYGRQKKDDSKKLAVPSGSSRLAFHAPLHGSRVGTALLLALLRDARVKFCGGDTGAGRPGESCEFGRKRDTCMNARRELRVQQERRQIVRPASWRTLPKTLGAVFQGAKTRACSFAKNSAEGKCLPAGGPEDVFLTFPHTPRTPHTPRREPLCLGLPVP